MNTLDSTSGEDAFSPDNDGQQLLETIVRNVRARAKRRIAWRNHISEESRLLADEQDTPEAESEWYKNAPELEYLREELRDIDDALETYGGRLIALAANFGLSFREVALLQCALAPEIDPSIAGLYALIESESSGVSHTGRGVNQSLAARLFDFGRARLWDSTMPSAQWRLIRPLDDDAREVPRYIVDPIVRQWLEKQPLLDEFTVGRVSLCQSHEPLKSWAADDLLEEIQRVIASGNPVRVILRGFAGAGRRTLAAWLVEQMGIQSLCFDPSGLEGPRLGEFELRVHRLARLTPIAPVWLSYSGRLQDPLSVTPTSLQFYIVDHETEISTVPGVVDLERTINIPDVDERRAQWQQRVPSCIAWPEDEFDEIVTRYRLLPGDLRAVGERQPTDAAAAKRHCRERTRHHLGDVGQLFDGEFSWSDLVVEPDLREALEDFSYEARERARFWERPEARRIFPRGTGLVAMMIGPPGTGKTMAAQVIARSLDLDLIRIDLASVISKYIGETAKNLQAIFRSARRLNAVLFFDEADALFANRTEVRDSHDRHANTDTNYLLQLIEEYKGVALLASNKKRNIDVAFLRRVRYILEFNIPSARERHKIWRQVAGALYGTDDLRRLEPAFDALSRELELTGAQIKNVILSADFAARRRGGKIGIHSFILAAARELDKTGASISPGAIETLRRIGRGA